MKTALILGGADCLVADRDAALKLFTPTFLIATNHAGRDHEGRLDAWATMHPDDKNKMPAWVIARRQAGRPDAGQLWRPQHRQPGGGLEMRAIPAWGGSSGLLAVTGALLALDCQRVVLAGVPMEAKRAHYDDVKPWTEVHRYQGAWSRYFPQMRGKVRSMSGWTRQLLGEPDEEWLACL